MSATTATSMSDTEPSPETDWDSVRGDRTGRDRGDTAGGEGFFETAATRLEALRHRIDVATQVLRGSSLSTRSFRPADGPLATFRIPDGEIEVDRYWVNAPFAYVVTTYDDEASERYYYAVEPDLDSFERELLARIKTDIRAPLMYQSDDDASTDDVLIEELARLIETYGIEVDMGTFHALFYYLKRDFRGFGKLDPLLNDAHIEDISCDGYDLPIFVYHDEYTDIETNISFAEQELDNFVIRLAQQSGQHISVGDPMVEATLEDGSRAELSLGREVKIGRASCRERVFRAV